MTTKKKYLTIYMHNYQTIKACNQPLKPIVAYQASGDCSSSAAVGLLVTSCEIYKRVDKIWICIQKMDGRSKYQKIRFIAALVKLWVESKARKFMGLTVNILELSMVIVLYTDQLIVLESVLPFQPQTELDRQELTELGQPSGVMNRIYRTKLRHNFMDSNTLENEKGVLESFFKELSAVENHDRSLVIISHGYIELLLNNVIDAKCKNGKNRITKNNRDFPLSVKLTLLNELGVVDETLLKILDKFRKIRNRAAHEASFSITTAEWQVLSNGLNRFLPGESKIKPNDLSHFCKLLIGTLWNENLDIVSHIKL